MRQPSWISCGLLLLLVSLSGCAFDLETEDESESEAATTEELQQTELEDDTVVEVPDAPSLSVPRRRVTAAGHEETSGPFPDPLKDNRVAEPEQPIVIGQ